MADHDPTMDTGDFDRLSDEQKDAALDHMLECIATSDSKLLDPQYSNNLIPEIARSGAPHAANIFVRHAQQGSGADLVPAIRKCLAQRAGGPPITVGPLIHAAHKCGANLEPWRRLVLDEQRKDDAPEPELVRGDQERESPEEAPVTSTSGDEIFVPEQEEASSPQTSEPNDGRVAAEFLEKLRPGGFWALTAIVPDGKTTTTTAYTADQVEAFVCKYNGKRNLYYAVNPTRTAMSKKAAKTDIAAIEYIPFDLDPANGETPEAAKARYLAQLNGAFEPNSTAVIDSGNGLNGLCRLQERIVLGEPVNGKFSPEDQAKIDDVEARAAALMRRLGAKAGTQNIDRILRLPGTTNLPNAKKRKEGRVACQTKLLWFEDTSYPLDAFPKEEPDKRESGKKKAAGREADALAQAISEGAPEGERSEVVWFVVNEMLRRGYRTEAIVRVLLDRNNAISEHIYDQAKPHEYAARQVEQAIEKIEFICNKKGKILPIPANIRIALLKLGVSVRYDQFADRTLLDGLPGYGPVLEDAAVNRLWLQFFERLDFSSNLELVRLVVNDTARLNGFHPVRDYLDALQWDGVPRVDKWLITYAGAEDSTYTRAVGALKLIAAVRRVRRPGCKFDEMLILEQPQQGTDKSSAWAVMAVQEDWFADDLPLNVEGKRVIETLRGRWIVEASELSGMRKTDVEHLKALLSRRIDRGRPAYGRLPIEAPRQCILVGSTNRSEYLRDTTGNRRFWPVLIKRFDLDALRRDRGQLWAEAAVREAKGESIQLAKELWPEAAKEQRQRLADDPFVAVLANHLGHLEGKIKAVDVWSILDLRGAQLTQDVYARAAEAMKRIGWKRPNKAGILRFGGQPTAAYVRGDSQKTIEVVRDKDGLRITEKDDDLPELQALLHELLKDDKQVPQHEVEQAVKAKGFTEKQLHTARHKLSIEVIKDSGKEPAGLFWRLPNFSKGYYHYE